MHLLSGSGGVLQRWRLADGQEAGNQSGMDLSAISVSGNGKWIVCGTRQGASVWDEQIQEKAIDVAGSNYVVAVDVSPGSGRFATGTTGDDGQANIWNIVTGERLAGPLRHHYTVKGVKFCPNGERVATACEDSIRIFNSHIGDQLITVEVSWKFFRWLGVTPVAWSNNGQQIFAASDNNKIIAFNSSTGSQLVESQAHGSHTGNNSDFRPSIALAANEKFLTTFAPNAITFWDASTLARIGPVIEDKQRLCSIALSPDCSYVATGRYDGKIMIRNLSNILPDLYGPFHVSICAHHVVE